MAVVGRFVDVPAIGVEQDDKRIILVHVAQISNHLFITILDGGFTGAQVVSPGVDHDDMRIEVAAITRVLVVVVLGKDERLNIVVTIPSNVAPPMACRFISAFSMRLVIAG